MKRIIFYLVYLTILLSASAEELTLPNGFTIDIPQQFQQITLADKFSFCWTNKADSNEVLYFTTVPDIIKYDLEKCFNNFHKIVFNLDNYAIYDEKKEGILDWRKDYIERYLYNLDDKSRFIIRTSYANNIPYLIAYSYPKDKSADVYYTIVSSIKFNGSWWQRLRTLFNQSLGLLIFAPILVCILAIIISIFLPKKMVTVVALIIFIFLAFLCSKSGI